MSSQVGGVKQINWNSWCANVQICASIDEQVEDTSMHGENGAQVFATMINFVYHKNCQLDKKSVEELFEIVNITKMYDVASLMTHVGVTITIINLNNVVELAQTAE